MSGAKQAKGAVSEPEAYKQFHEHTQQLLATRCFCAEVAAELQRIPVPSPTPAELVAADLLVRALFQAAENTLPPPAQPQLFSVGLARPSDAPDPEYTQILLVSPEQRTDAFQATETLRRFEFEARPEDSARPGAKRGPGAPKAPLQVLQQPGAETGKGTFELLARERPPSATDVRQANRRRQEHLQRLAETQRDVSALAQTHLDDMQRALALESKGGRRVERLPDGCQYIVDDDGRVVGVAHQTARNHLEPPRAGVSLKADQTGAKRRRDDERAAAAEAAQQRKQAVAEATQRVQESLHGGVTPVKLMMRSQGHGDNRSPGQSINSRAQARQGPAGQAN